MVAVLSFLVEGDRNPSGSKSSSSFPSDLVSILLSHILKKETEREGKKKKKKPARKYTLNNVVFENLEIDQKKRGGGVLKMRTRESTSGS